MSLRFSSLLLLLLLLWWWLSCRLLHADPTVTGVLGPTGSAEDLSATKAKKFTLEYRSTIGRVRSSAGNQRELKKVVQKARVAARELVGKFSSMGYETLVVAVPSRLSASLAPLDPERRQVPNVHAIGSFRLANRIGRDTLIALAAEEGVPEPTPTEQAFMPGNQERVPIIDVAATDLPYAPGAAAGRSEMTPRQILLSTSLRTIGERYEAHARATEGHLAAAPAPAPVTVDPINELQSMSSTDLQELLALKRAREGGAGAGAGASATAAPSVAVAGAGAGAGAGVGAAPHAVVPTSIAVGVPAGSTPAGRESL